MAMDAAPASDLTPGLGHERPSFHHSGERDSGSHSSERQLRAHSSWRQAALGVGGVEPDLQSRVAVLPKDSSKDQETRIVELNRARNLSKSTRELIVKRALATDEQDAERLLRKVRERQDRVGMEIPSVEVRFENLTIESSVYIGSRALPSVLNAYRNFFETGLQLVGLLKNQKRRFTMLDDVSGIIHPGRLCLLLGPPGSGKTTLLRALAAKTGGLKVQGNVTYNGHAFNEFFVPRTAAYIDQTDNHTGQLTVRETFDFATRVQGVGSKAKDMEELRQREKKAGIEPDWDIDAYMKAQTLEGKRESIQTDYILSILGLDVCADTLVGNQMIRGISGGQKKRVSTGEMMCSPKNVFFMDEISTGLDSSTTFQIVKVLRDLCHFSKATMLISLLQPAPETYNLFDDVLVLSEGSSVYHGPIEGVMPFFGTLGFQIQGRKDIPTFLQEVTSRKDQKQFWVRSERWQFVPVSRMADAFKDSQWGQQAAAHLAQPYDRSKSHPDALIHTRYALSGLDAFKANMFREVTLVRRNAFVYIFKTAQAGIVAIIAATLYLRTHIHDHTLQDGTLIQGFLFFSLLVMLFNGIAEMTFSIEKLPVFFKHRDNLMYPAWTTVVPTTILRLPYSLVEATLWTVLTYFEVGLSLNAGRFFAFLCILFLMHNCFVNFFRAIGSICRNIIIANAVGSFAMLCVLMLGGFVISSAYIHRGWKWFCWINPLFYAQRAIIVNEFTDARWVEQPSPIPGYPNLGVAVMQNRSFPTQRWWCWLGMAVLIFFAIFFQTIVILAHMFLSGGGKGQVIVSEESLMEREAARKGGNPSFRSRRGTRSSRGSFQSSRKSISQSQLGLGPGQQLSQKQLDASTRGMADPAMGNGTAIPEGKESVEELDAKDGEVEEGSAGMVLPFQSSAVTFRGMNYFVPAPPAMPDGPQIKDVGGKRELQLLNDINGCFSPGILSCLMGVSGAGKTTLMDVLACRKTGGRIEGEVLVNGHPQEAATFARISGYVEQFDVHSPQTTVHEALMFSARCRLSREHDNETVLHYVEEVEGLVELMPLRDALVGAPGINGLSVEQRKRLTIAVELVANPAIVFMDEPTSGLDARAAAVVMRTVRNIVNTGRTMVSTIHQPSIDIFEAFDELLLLKRGGRVIYCGPLGTNSVEMIKYFETIPNVPPHKEGVNPATWMLEISTPGQEKRTGVDFAEHYDQSEQYRRYSERIDRFSIPKEGSQPTSFKEKYPLSFYGQYTTCLRKFIITNWRAPEFNGVRYLITVLIALVFGTVFYKYGQDTSSQATLFNAVGALYASTLFLGIVNSISVQPTIAAERGVYYREQPAGYYAVLPWYLALATTQYMYIAVQGVLYVCIVYFMCGFALNAGKFFWFLLYLLLTLCIFTFYGVMSVFLTPNLGVSTILSSAFYAIFNVFAGFAINPPSIPGWWIWYYWIDPVAHTIYGLVASQLADENDKFLNNNGQMISVPEYLRQHFGFHHSYIGYAVLVLAGFVILFMAVGAIALKTLKFLKR